MNEADDALCHVVTWGCLPAKDRDPGHHILTLCGGEGFDPLIPVDAVQGIELLALVLVDALDLDVKQSGGINADATLFTHDFRQPLLAVELHGPPLTVELIILSEGAEVLQTVQISEPLPSVQPLGKDDGQVGVCLWCTSIIQEWWYNGGDRTVGSVFVRRKLLFFHVDGVPNRALVDYGGAVRAHKKQQQCFSPG